ncbi:MAG: hypothetical protein O6914_07910, partial [Chloroflexi bacterium]|nr:hypothetical protein [Chloroflexota bacterium]
MARKERDPREASKSVDVVCQVLLEKARDCKDELGQTTLSYSIVRTQLFEGKGLPNPKRTEFESALSERGYVPNGVDEKLGNLRLYTLGNFLYHPDVRAKLKKAWIDGRNSFGVEGRFPGRHDIDFGMGNYRLTGPKK